MTVDLGSSIETLYQTFSIYPFKSTMQGCPCCVSESDKEKIHSKLLRELDREDLSRYAFKAMTTWGEVEDFKHYLPRIFELLATTNFIVDTFVVLGKLQFGKWKEWPESEQKAISVFLLAWLEDMIKYKSYFDQEAFVEIYKLIGDIDILLDRWKISFEDNSFSNYIDLVHDYYTNVSRKNNEFKELDIVSIEKLKTWINENAIYFEPGFFYFTDKDPEFAEKISITQYICAKSRII